MRPAKSPDSAAEKGQVYGQAMSFLVSCGPVARQLGDTLRYCAPRTHSAVAPASLTSSAHFGSSLLMKAAKSRGVPSFEIALNRAKIANVIVLLPTIRSASTTGAVPTRCAQRSLPPSSGRPTRQVAFLWSPRCRAGYSSARLSGLRTAPPHRGAFFFCQQRRGEPREHRAISCSDRPPD